MTTQPGSSAPVVVGVDLTGPDSAAIAWAAAEAARRRAPLLIVTAFPWPPSRTGGPHPGAVYRSTVRERSAAHLADAAALATASAPGVATSTRMLVGPAVAALMTASRTAQVLVLGTRTDGSATAAGSTVVAAISRAACPVVVVRGGRRPERPDAATLPVVVGIDGTSRSDAATGFAFASAAARGAPLVAVHTSAVPAFGAGSDLLAGPMALVHEALLVERLRPWTAAYPGVPVERVVVRGHAASVLLDRAGSAQLLVVGSHGHTGLLGRLLGSVSRAAVHGSSCPVAIVRESLADQRFRVPALVADASAEEC
jgi:nucleotide-binding universal stress UspA family protein